MTLRANLRLIVRLFALAPLFAVGLPAQAVALRLVPSLAERLPVPFHRLLLRILGVRVHRKGAVPPAGTLVVANHISWLDIPVIGAIAPLSFVAKNDVADWPLFGTLARLQATVFVDRTRRIATGGSVASIGERLAGGARIVLFAEGTTSDGHRVLPLRSALIGAATNADTPVAVAPLTVRYTARHGLPIARRDMPQIAWYGDMALLPHLAALLRGGPIDVELTFGPAAVPRQARKLLTRELETYIRQGRRSI